jgi:hypothetical protein
VLAGLGDLTGCSRDNFQMTRMQAKMAKVERAAPIAANDIFIYKAAGMLAGASHRFRPAGRRKRRDHFMN